MKKFLIGCGIFFLVCIVAGVIAVVVGGPMIWAWIQGKAAEEQARQTLSNEWEPPTASVNNAEDLQKLPDDTLFPSKVGEAKRESVDDNADIPDLGITSKGKHAVYKVGADTVDAYAFVLTEAQKEVTRKFVEAEYEKGKSKGGTRQYTNLNYRVYLVTPEAGQNHLWFLKEGWLYVFRTKASEDKEPFVMDFLKANSGKGKPTNANTPPSKDTGDNKPEAKDKGVK